MLTGANLASINWIWIASAPLVVFKPWASFLKPFVALSQLFEMCWPHFKINLLQQITNDRILFSLHCTVHPDVWCPNWKQGRPMSHDWIVRSVTDQNWIAGFQWVQSYFHPLWSADNVMKHFHLFFFFFAEQTNFR